MIDCGTTAPGGTVGIKGASLQYFNNISGKMPQNRVGTCNPITPANLFRCLPFP
jgi:hypothetical protein